ncbi:MAG: hypothetical protein WCJ69_08135 [Betaproteobacteria bacterium]
MTRLPDPRPVAFVGCSDATLVSRLEAAVAARGSGRDCADWEALVRAVRRRHESGESGAVAELLRGAPPDQAPLLFRAVDDAINAIGTGEDLPIVTRLFLIPLVLVVGGAAPGVVAGAVPQIAAVRDGLRAGGAFGPVESFGLGNALGGYDDAVAVSPGRLHALVRSGDPAGGVDLLAPCPIELTGAEETVHLRFLAGASLTAPDAPTFLETAGQVGRWGMGVSRELTRQLAPAGVSLLALPRAPMAWFAALAEGFFAREEIAFSLFATSAIRRLRSETGDPVATLSAADDATIRVALASPFDPLNEHTHAWRLGPAADLARVESSILDLLRECRVTEVAMREEVMPAAPPGTSPVAGRLLS